MNFYVLFLFTLRSCGELCSRVVSALSFLLGANQYPLMALQDEGY